MNDNLRILIARTDRIGDVVLSTAIPREIKRNNPKAFVAVLVKEYTKDIFLENPNIDEIVVYNPQESFLKTVLAIRKFNFSDAITLLPDKRINWLLFYAGIKTRTVNGFKFYQFITNSKSVFRRKYKPLKSEAEYCLDTIRKLGMNVESNASEIHLSSDEKKISESIRGKYLGKSLIGVHASSGSSAPNMKTAEYVKLVKQLAAKPDIQLFVTDNNPREELLNIEGVVYPNIGKTLRESIINFSALDVLISASTGPMHLSGALKVATLSLFCPMTACSPILWGPMGNKVKYVIPDKEYCLKKCPGDPKKCFFEGDGGINSEKVLNELKELIPSD
jgi:ADP-heptose:LPS heptosyltransferase